MQKEENDIFKETSDMIINECRMALDEIDPKTVINLIDAILSSEKVFFIGVGRVMLSLKATVKRFAHLGIKAHYVGQITEPAITDKDLLIVGSGSGESLVPVTIAKKAHLLGAKIAHIGSNPNSSIKDITDIFVRIPVKTKLNLKDEIDSNQPMSSLFEQCLFLFGDILSKMIIVKKNINVKELWKHHANLE